MARNSILVLYKDRHPLVSKFNLHLVEALNATAESSERTQQIIQLVKESTSICEEQFGNESLFLVRHLYTLYTATLHEESRDGQEVAMDHLASLTHNGKPVKANQYLFKAVCIDAMLMMQYADPRRIEAQLSQTLEMQMAYAEGDKNHPFLEEVVTIFASYFESQGSF